ncbi:MAG TPA: response regulator, partial [Burkholderiaceae bacterium]
DADDELDQTDAVDVDLFPIFEEEAVELLPQLGAALRQWTARPDNTSARTEVLRVLHTLKGSARLAGALRLGELAHLFESEIESRGAEPADPALLAPLLGRFDALQATFDQLRASDARRYAALTGPAEPPAPVAPPPQALLVPEQPAPRSTLGPVPALDITIAAGSTAASRQAAAQTVRVRAQLLERLLNQAGEIMLTRARMESELGQLRGALKDMTGNLDRLRLQLRDVELQAETQMASRLAQAKESQQGFDPLEFDRFTRVQELTHMMAESVNDVGTVQRNLQRTVEVGENELAAQARQTRELQRDLLRTRMLEFEGISERLYRVVRQTSKETGKQVALDIVGGRIEMDRAVLDRMTPSFEHLLRNAVVHGIEPPQARLDAGKPAQGRITVRLRQDGNDVSVEFEDDGQGLDLQAIQRRAAALGLVDASAVLDDSTAAGLIQQPGFSTAAEVTELAGRGIGMDVVRAEVTALGGRIETHSTAGSGTRFQLVLPLTTAVTQVVLLRMGSLSIGVPAGVLELVRRTTPAELAQAYASGSIRYGGEEVPFYWAGALLQSTQRSTEGAGRTTPVVLVRSAGQRVALHVDEVLGNQEVVVKNLGVQLARLPGLSAMTVLASGAIVLIYNPLALAALYGAQARSWMSAAGSGQPQLGRAVPASDVPLVLVVDDSVTVRRVTQRLLQREGYRVALAADGLQALKLLQGERPLVVLSDIEMPRMDGFDLLRSIRNDTSLADLPVVMITSRIAQKHRDHARALGADHYLGKPYSEDALLALVRQYSAARAEAAP